MERISLTLLKACSCSVFHANGTSAFIRLLIGAVTVDICTVTSSSAFLSDAECLSCTLVLAY